MRAARRSGRLVIEALVALLIIGAILAGTGDVFREGQRLRARFAAESAARGALASEVARLCASLSTPEAPPDERIVRPFRTNEGVEGEIELVLAPAEPGTVIVSAVVRWRAGEHTGVVERRVVARRRP